MSAKRHGGLLGARARTGAHGVEIELPDGRRLTPEQADADQQLGAWLGAEVRLERIDPASESSAGVYEFAFDVDDSPAAEWFDIDVPAGSFADLAHAHLLTTGSLAAAAEAHPGGDWDRRRFRPSILIETPGAPGFIEDAWIGNRLRAGSVTLHVDMPTIRCVMPTRQQPPLGEEPALCRDKAIARAVADVHGHNLGVYASVVSGGEVAVGDEVVLVGQQAQ